MKGDVVQQDLLDNRREGGDDHADDRHAEGKEHVLLVARQPRPQLPDPPLLLDLLVLVTFAARIGALNVTRTDCSRHRRPARRSVRALSTAAARSSNADSMAAGSSAWARTSWRRACMACSA